MRYRRLLVVLFLAFVAAPALGGGAMPTAARTCSESACSDLGWTNAAFRGDSNVCSAASAAGGVLPKADARCSGDLPWAAAVGFCEGFGARLCSQAETAAGNAAALGCELEAKLVWTSTSCGDGSDPVQIFHISNSIVFSRSVLRPFLLLTPVKIMTMPLFAFRQVCGGGPRQQGAPRRACVFAGRHGARHRREVLRGRRGVHTATIGRDETWQRGW